MLSIFIQNLHACNLQNIVMKKKTTCIFLDEDVSRDSFTFFGFGASLGASLVL